MFSRRLSCSHPESLSLSLSLSLSPVTVQLCKTPSEVGTNFQHNSSYRGPDDQSGGCYVRMLVMPDRVRVAPGRGQPLITQFMAASGREEREEAEEEEESDGQDGL
jgi:hypothetical protein